MDEAYGVKYKELYEKHWWWRAREDFILSTLERIQAKKHRGPILDVGCGDGLIFDRLSAWGEVEGVETNPLFVSKEGPWRSRIHVCPFDETFRPCKRYSLILMLDILEHFFDPLICLRRGVELLEPNGTLLITVPAFPCLWTSHDELNHHFKRYTKTTLTEVTRRAGIEVLSCRYFFQWTFPVKLMVRLKEGFLDASVRPPKIPPHWVNDTLYRVSKVEQKVFGLLPVPFGSSLILVGGKV